MSTQQGQEYVDIAIVVPLEEELLEVLEVFPSIENRSTPTSFRHLVQTGADGITCLVTQQSEMGRTSATEAANGIAKDFEVGLFICLGIAGGLTDDLNLADVCYSGQIVDVIDNAKTTDKPGGKAIELTFSPTFYETPRDLTTALNFVRTQPELKPIYESWLTECEESARDLVPGPVPGRNNSEINLLKPRSMNGVIACGSVSKSQNYNRLLAQLDRKLLAIETESGGVFAVGKSLGKPALTIRGLSDYADKNKSKIEAQSKGGVRTLAARNAATFLRMQLRNEFFLNYLKGNKAQRPLAFGPTNAVKPQAQVARETLSEIAGDVDQHLKELCPEYKLQPQGYRLPIPRAKLKETARELKEARRSSQVEIRAVVGLEPKIMLDVPKSYPDQALPWMIAHDLLTNEIAGAQPIPIVIDGSKIAPPTRGFERISGVDINALATVPGFTPVLIVDNCPLESKTRMEYFLNEVRRFESCRFVFISRGNGQLLYSSAFRLQFEVELFEICDVSFFELTHFIERNFQLEISESEVVAYKLQDTFRRYELSAHPSYLAAISNSALSALISANRRSELIQLAVDATLSFVVAGDTSDLSLSRTTRTRFLQKLVRATRVDGSNLDQSAVVQFAISFAEEFDFDIDPLQFVVSFIEHGILHVENERIEVSLPYVESYLLARELLTDPTAAAKYFNLSEEFDEPTFDIYAELGPSPDVVQKIRNSIAAALDDYAGDEHEDEKFLDIKATSGEGLAAAKFQHLHTQMQEAINDITTGGPATEKKQQILDMRQEVRSKAADFADANQNKDPQTVIDTDQRLPRAFKAWGVGLMLLNRGAEHLTADVKRSLASQLVALGSRLLSAWVSQNSKVNFPAIREGLTTDDFIADFCRRHNVPDQNHMQATLKIMMGSIVDLLEERFLSLPFSTLLAGFGNARQRVLARSLSNVQPSRLSERLFRSLWLLELDPLTGEQGAITVIEETPKSALLRSTICSQILMTAFWNFSDKKAKQSLANAADQCLRPFSQSVDRKLLDI